MVGPTNNLRYQFVSLCFGSMGSLNRAQVQEIATDGCFDRTAGKGLVCERVSQGNVLAHKAIGKKLRKSLGKKIAKKLSSFNKKLENMMTQLAEKGMYLDKTPVVSEEDAEYEESDDEEMEVLDEDENEDENEDEDEEINDGDDSVE
uniref:Uncharacterized protein n=1 Tax=Tanacetum cinerariifolium TaxID=118510 RepID=A0A699JBJ6_TANCI|nr:hypothetical protein [Tanacetum cinerariifolium]